MDADHVERTTAEGQAELAVLSSHGRVVVAEDGGHEIHLDQPALVVDAIGEVVEEVRRRRRKPRGSRT